jgi:hypothetical protein
MYYFIILETLQLNNEYQKNEEKQSLVGLTDGWSWRKNQVFEVRSSVPRSMQMKSESKKQLLDNTQVFIASADVASKNSLDFYCKTKIEQNMNILRYTVKLGYNELGC